MAGMNSFLRKCLLFTSPIFLVIIVFSGIYHQKIAVVTERMQDISEKYSVLIMGDSVMQRISPDYFDDPAYNFAVSAEH